MGIKQDLIWFGAAGMIKAQTHLANGQQCNLKLNGINEMREFSVTKFSPFLLELFRTVPITVLLKTAKLKLFVGCRRILIIHSVPFCSIRTFVKKCAHVKAVPNILKHKLVKPLLFCVERYIEGFFFTVFRLLLL